jgi:hypothetical protein
MPLGGLSCRVLLTGVTMPGASEQTRRVKHVNANWVPRGDPPDGTFEVQIITDDGERHEVPASAASVTALAALAQAGAVMAWDPKDGRLIVANIVGQMPWTLPREDQSG